MQKFNDIIMIKTWNVWLTKVYKNQDLIMCHTHKPHTIDERSIFISTIASNKYIMKIQSMVAPFIYTIFWQQWKVVS
jgi:hypothetical protein